MSPPSLTSSRTPESLSKLHDLADTLESHLNAAELLSSYGVNLTPRHLRDMQGDTARVGEVLTKVTRLAAKRWVWGWAGCGRNQRLGVLDEGKNV